MGCGQPSEPPWFALFLPDCDRDLKDSELRARIEGAWAQIESMENSASMNMEQTGIMLNQIQDDITKVQNEGNAANIRMEQAVSQIETTLFKLEGNRATIQ